MTKDAELLTASDHFDITGRGLVLLPDFDVPMGWRNRSTSVLVVTPGGEQSEFSAQLELTHFNIRDPDMGVSRRWRASVSLPTASKSAVPIGSKLLCESELKAALSAVSNAEQSPSDNR